MTDADTNALMKTNITDDLLKDFFHFLDVSDKTRATYQRALKQLFRFFASNGITTPTHDDIMNFKFTLNKAGKKAATVALYLAATKRFFAWCEQRGFYKDITTGIKPPKQERGHKRDFLGATQLKHIFSNMKRDTLIAKRNYAILSLMTVGGLRTIEISRANIEDIRFLGDCTVLYVQGKGRNDKSEFVKLPAPVYDAISEYLSARGCTDPSCPLFASTANRNKGGRLTTRSISQIAKNAMIEAGYNSSRLTAHSLRHSAVTLSLLGGLDLAEVQAFARHCNIATTQIYSHTVDRIKSFCEGTISNMIFGR